MNDAGSDRTQAKFALYPPTAFLAKGGGRIVHPPQNDFDGHDPEGERGAYQGDVAPAAAENNNEVSKQKEYEKHLVKDKMAVRFDKCIASPRKNSRNENCA
ncbi:hypothetical protein [Methylocystis echinoides]|uniref:hypothetical protein n=1 Tax=Methylocystis echinoides TaxID=29468 RepID=UPI00342F5179